MSDKPPEVTDIDILEVADKKNVATYNPEHFRMKLACWVLGAIFVLFIAVGVAVMFGDPAQAKIVFDPSVAVLPPIVTLILGYYFASKK